MTRCPGYDALRKYLFEVQRQLSNKSIRHIVAYEQADELSDSGRKKNRMAAMSLALETAFAVQLGAMTRKHGAQLSDLSPWSDFQWEGLNVKFPFTQLSSFCRLSQETLTERLDVHRARDRERMRTSRDKIKRAIQEGIHQAYHCEACNVNFNE